MKLLPELLKIYLVILACQLLTPAYAGSYKDFFTFIDLDRAEEIEVLLNKGFDPNTVNEEGVPALILAAQRKSFNAIAVLVKDKKTNLNVISKESENTLMLAAIQNQIDLAKLLIEQGAEVNKPGWTPLHYAATKGHIDIMRLLIEHSAYLDAESPNGTTALMMAAYYGTPQAVKLLLEEGADPLLKNKLGLSAMDFAKQSTHKDSQDYIQAFINAATAR